MTPINSRIWSKSWSHSGEIAIENCYCISKWSLPWPDMRKISNVTNAFAGSAGHLKYYCWLSRTSAGLLPTLQDICRTLCRFCMTSAGFFPTLDICWTFIDSTGHLPTPQDNCRTFVDSTGHLPTLQDICRTFADSTDRIPSMNITEGHVHRNSFNVLRQNCFAGWIIYMHSCAIIDNCEKKEKKKSLFKLNTFCFIMCTYL